MIGQDVGSKTETQVQCQLNKCSGAISNLEKIVDELEIRLVEVLSSPPIETQEETKLSTPLVTLANEISMFTSRIYIVTDRINDIKKRIEL